MNTVVSSSPSFVSIESDPLDANNTRTLLDLQGSNLFYSGEDDTLSGIVTGAFFTVVFDASTIFANTGAVGPFPDLRLFEAIDVSYDFSTATPIDDVATGISLVYASLLQASGLEAPQLVTVYGTSNVTEVYGGSDQALFITGSDVSLFMNRGNDFVQADVGAGDLRAHLGFGDDTAVGATGADRIIGSAGSDSISGGEGNDRLFGGADQDTLDGGEGNDFLSGGTGADEITGGIGNDRMDGGEGNDVLRGGDDNDTITGGNGGDVIFGGGGNDRLVGGDGRDVLIAGEGDTGNDLMFGGAGADAFVFITDSLNEQSGVTIIRDFDLDEDMLWTGPSNNGTWSAQEAFALFSAGVTARDDRIVYREDDNVVMIMDVTIEDITQDHFVDGSQTGYFGWA